MSALGQKQTLAHILGDVRFTPKSGHWLSRSGCPLCAKSGHPHPVEENPQTMASWLVDSMAIHDEEK
jgi:hypothetical protein